MGHFAKVLNDKVIDIIVAEPEFFETFVDSTPGEWIQTSYNTRGGVHYDPETGNPSADQSKALRFRYAIIGGTYDRARDAFIPPQPYPSWTFNEETMDWDCPVPLPDEQTTSGEGDHMYVWNEEDQTWDQCDSCTI